MLDFPFNDDQKAAIAMAVQWYRDLRDGVPDTPKFFALGGYAGTGKTTVARYIASQCAPPSRVTYIAPTGKAAARLRDKGCAGAKTIHKFLYHFLGQQFDDELEFEVKGTLDEQPLLIVCDEASMIGRSTGWDLMSKNVPVLFLGDLGQVDPVNDDAFLSEDDFSYNLTKIERNGGNIVKASFVVRGGDGHGPKRLPAREYDDVKIYDRRYTMRDVEDHTDEDSVMICSYNNTRQLLNTKARIALGRDGMKMPVIGEKLICTFNQHSYSVYNGEQFILEELRDLSESEMSATDDEFMKMARLRSITNQETKLAKLHIGCFIGADEDERRKCMRASGGFDFGYALTIHKSQGSEWKRVMVMEEFMKSSPYAKLMYTAITRAIEHLTVFRAK